ncbi:unnamed protein product, partial [Porites evermanni]
MRLLLSELKLLIIDEISMVSNVTLLHIHQRLQEIFGTSGSLLFGGKSIIAAEIENLLGRQRSETGGLDFEISVKETARRLRKTSFIDKPAIVRKNEESIIITVLNIRSLLKHSVDIKFDGNINDSDLLLLTETQLLPEIDDKQIRDNLPYTL